MTPKQKDILLSGITGEVEETGKILLLTCTINRIRPKAVAFYWIVNGHKENGTLEIESNNGGFKQTSSLEYRY